LFLKDANGTVIGHTTSYDYPNKKNPPTDNRFLPEGDVIVNDIVRVFVSPESLQDLEKFIEIDKASNRPETGD
jgi:hypothetical protein